MKKHNAKISISRNSNDEINITITDENSGIEFFDGIMTPYDYAQLITGLSHVEIVAEYRGLDNLGKTFVSERRQIECTLNKVYDRRVLSHWLLDNAQEDGWTIDSYLGSQSSVSYAKMGMLF